MIDPLPDPADIDAVEQAIFERGADARRLKRQLDDATATPIFIDYHLGPGWFDGVDDAMDALEERADADPLAALLLAEYGLRRLEDADLDDSDGWLSQAFPRLEGLHAKASLQLGLEGRALAGRLRSLAAASDMEAFYDAPNTHRQPLGDSGLRALMEDGPEGPE